MASIKHPPSIISIDTTVCVGRYAAYVYKYTNILNNKWYVGWHIGIFDGTYWHSSENQEFLKVFGGLQPILKLEILHVGLIIDMKNTESKILTDQKAKSNPLSYNNAGAPTGNKEPVDIEKCQQIVIIINDLIDDNKYQEEKLSVISALDTIQVRLESENKDHILRIREGVMETGLEFQTPVLIWEGQSPKTEDGDLRGDGNHTVKALEGLKNFTTIKTLRMSKDFVEEWNLNLDEIRYIGNLMNPRQVQVKLENVEEDAIKGLTSFLERGVIIDPKKTEYGKNYVKGYGFKGKKPAAICKKAELRYKASILAKSNLKIAKYDTNHKENLKLLQRTANKYRSDTSVVITYNTSFGSKIVREVMEYANDPNYKNVRYFHLVGYHNSEANRKAWDNREKDAIGKLINGIFSKMKPIIVNENGYEVEVARQFISHEMEHYEADVS